jgi:hypothetical protein
MKCSPIKSLDGTVDYTSWNVRDVIGCMLSKWEVCIVKLMTNGTTVLYRPYERL